ncbi:hypothetical protein OG729_38320 [Streptomyces sp. NBC_00210]|uniref:FHA domain-containing protein n=1 Tax=Streptomyces sp. NBC_00210 TaxID=2903636 RepID=UPI003249C9B4
MTEPFLTVTYTGEPDIVFEFAKEGDSRLFGRDDISCDIVIWSALNGRELSRVAGRIWRMEGELWLRNLSTTHELHLRIPHMPPEQPLRRRRDELARGDARSIPRPVCTVLGPDGCELQVRQVNQPAPEMFTYGLDNPTLSRVPEVPGHLRHIAAALCEPLLAGGYLPASYREVMSRIGEPSLKKVRMLVGELCTHYTDASPELKDRLLVRLVREQEQLGIPSDPQLRRGLWTFGQARAGTTEDRGAEEGNRRRALALPDYYEVAQILVSHFRVTAADVERLPAEEFRDD